MNTLENYIRKNKLNAATIMDWLQDRGWVSDNAIDAKDVAEKDATRAVNLMEAIKIARSA